LHFSLAQKLKTTQNHTIPITAQMTLDSSKTSPNWYAEPVSIETSLETPEPDIYVDDRLDAPPQEDETQENPHTRRQLHGAAAAGGLAGLLLGGPLIAIVAAGGCALAVSSASKAGDAARASGDAMAGVGDRVRKMDKKHHLVEKTSNGFIKGCKWVERRVKPKNPSPSITTETHLTHLIS
jgi:hypothetical protein